MRATLIALAALLLAACSASVHHAAAPPSHSPPTATPIVADISRSDEARVCADLNAMEFTGTSKADAHSTVAQADQSWLPGNASADVNKAVQDRCPSL